MGWFDFLSGKSGEKAVDAVIDAGDALFFTDEEKSKASLEALKLKIEWAKSTQGQNVSRRGLAWMITLSYIIGVFLGIALHLFDLKEGAEFVFKTMNETFSTPFTVIVGFYFGSALVGKLKN